MPDGAALIRPTECVTVGRICLMALRLSGLRSALLWVGYA
ncbi:hypothetical protein CKO_00623 [Citrobacter koseri ATCC BAA-895]|uniref:Uncharacterized protein n=1 Tax=Citrobacter koseri (strain ATCC BAA-895 / CDC 4225-83 / SGSC4696) TaxID=290338 RepID=A8AE64_CITK8|nr:hypothetical protein CKO_00623 [Citrobacter koseri ATCC BAA-895]